MTVMIATPSYDGTVDVRYVNSIVETIRSKPHGVEVYPVFIPGDAIVQRARNSLVKLALDADGGRSVDELMFIDADVFWKPSDFWRLLSHKEYVVGGLYRQTRDQQVLCFRPKKGSTTDERGLIEVESVGCGFLRISGEALRKMWASATRYSDGPVESRAVFEVRIDKGQIISEDIAMCHRWRGMKGKVYVDTAVACGHVGTKVYNVEVQRMDGTK
jgi:hypothetical protein